MWFRSKSTVICFYCTSTLKLTAPDPKGKGKERQVEGNFARGTHSKFECGVCGCTNETDENGQILSDPAAFRDAALTGRGTSTLSATPFSSPARLPSNPPPFCRECLSNQSLQIHLLSSYPSYSSDEEEDEEGNEFPPLPEYRQSLDRRYPLVCENCRQRVEDIVKERDYRVKTAILGGRLRETGKNKLEGTKEPSQSQRRKWILAGLVWRLRFVLWALSHVGTISIGLNGLFDRKEAFRIPYVPNPASIAMLILSPLWTFWDPTWDILRNQRKKRGGLSRVKVEHRQPYLILQGLAFSSRVVFAVISHLDLIASSGHLLFLQSILLLITLIALLSPLRIPRTSFPPPIYLRSTDSPSRPSTPTASHFPSSSVTPATFAEEDPLEPLQNLSLSKRISILASSSPSRSGVSNSVNNNSSSRDLRSRLFSIKGDRNAKFGQTSFSTTTTDSSSPSTFPESLNAPVKMQLEEEVGGDQDAENSMDWTPSTDSHQEERSRGIWFKPRSFVVPDLKAPTGLEGILERVGLRNEGGEGEKMDVDVATENPGSEVSGGGWWKRWIGG
ncbi:uncharacterized protein JCM6883_007421 [Sporobolomyces salmoneus]|uniref:uncharacterized protein n=1 Tax=Sporobolomyces salmoneus TaxID=183962 RepID=UPI0031745D87